MRVFKTGAIIPDTLLNEATRYVSMCLSLFFPTFVRAVIMPEVILKLISAKMLPTQDGFSCRRKYAVTLFY